MSHAVLSNRGEWESDMIGLVGMVGHEEEILSFIQTYLNCGESDVQTATMVSDPEEIQRTIEEEELSFFSLGRTELMVIIRRNFFFVNVF